MFLLFPLSQGFVTFLCSKSQAFWRSHIFLASCSSLFSSNVITKLLETQILVFFKVSFHLRRRPKAELWMWRWKTHLCRLWSQPRPQLQSHPRLLNLSPINRRFSPCLALLDRIAKEDVRFQLNSLGAFSGLKNLLHRPPPPQHPPPWNPQLPLHPRSLPLPRAQPPPQRRQRRRRRRRRRWRRRRRAAAAEQRLPWFPRPMSQRTLALWSWGAREAQLYQFECILWACIRLIGGRKKNKCVMYVMIHPSSGVTLCHLLSYFLSWH